MYMRASGASELRKCWHFHILKLLFPSIFLLVLQILCLRNIFNFRCQITFAYIYNQCSFLLLLMVWCYLNDSIPTNTNIEQMYTCVCVCVCERAERASLENFGIFTFLNCYFFQYFVGTSDTLSVQLTCLSAYMYRQISKCTDKTPKKHYWCPPPPPSGYANGMHHHQDGTRVVVALIP